MITISSYRNTLFAAMVVLSVLTLRVFGADATSFVLPEYWNTGDSYSTYQEWDVLTSSTGNAPDVGHLLNPSGLTVSTLGITSPGFLSGSANFYSFSGTYGTVANIFNYGGSSGAGAPAGYGTHVIIQTAASLNFTTGASVYADSLRLVQLDGSALTGGDNASRLLFDELWQGVVNSSYGPVTQQELIWEFFLPNYAGDFKILADVSVHSMFRQMRVDTMLAQQAVPEPATLALMLSGGAMFIWRRNRRSQAC